MAAPLFIASLILALALCYRPLGDYMYRVYTGTRHSAVERVIYRLLGVQADAEQRWGAYARAVPAFSVVSILFLYGLRPAAVSHDLRTPLASVKAAVESLRNTEIAWSEADRAELLATVEESLAKLDALVVNLLDMSRLQAGVLRLTLQPVALDEVVPRAVDDLGTLTEAMGGTLVPEETPGGGLTMTLTLPIST